MLAGVLAALASVIAAPSSGLDLARWIGVASLLMAIEPHSTPRVSIDALLRPSTMVALLAIGSVGPAPLILHVALLVALTGYRTVKQDHGDVVATMAVWSIGALVAAAARTDVVALAAGVALAATIMPMAHRQMNGLSVRPDAAAFARPLLAGLLLAVLGAALRDGDFVLMAFVAAAFSIRLSTVSGHIKHLGAVIDGATGDQERATAANAALETLRALAESRGGVDALTGLDNRRRFDVAMATARGPVVLVLGDVGGLKHINDAGGHPAGDALLCAVAAAITTTIRTHDGGYRFTPAGDEYALLLRGATEDQITTILARLADNVATAVAREPLLAGYDAWLRVGAATAPAGAVDGVALFAAAEEQLRAAHDADIAAGRSRPRADA